MQHLLLKHVREVIRLRGTYCVIHIHLTLGIVDQKTYHMQPVFYCQTNKFKYMCMCISVLSLCLVLLRNLFASIFHIHYSYIETE